MIATVRPLAVVVAILLLAALAASPAHAGGADDCARNVACLDALAPDDSWQSSISLPAVSGKYRGDGITVASIDTGVTPHADLGSRLLERVDFTDDHDGLDHFGHGTHMAGLIAGDGSTSADAYEGAAPRANLVSVKVASWDGAVDVSTVIAALQWVVSHRERYGIRVVNLSWGTDATQPAQDDPLDAAVERAVREGLVVVVSAGNSGPDTVSKPGDAPSAITVGAADTGGTADPADDALAGFSSASTDKPDVLAPGVSLVSDRAPGSTIDTFRPDARVGDHMFKGSGTSQAAAVTSGVVARMLAANPSLTPAQVKSTLTRSTGGRLAGPGAGAGMIDAAAAVAAALPDRRRGDPVALPGDIPDEPAAPPAGSLDASRGTHPVVADLDGDGIPAPLTGEIDALGNAWDAASLDLPWTEGTWALSPWAQLVAEIPGSVAAPTWTGPEAPLVAWDVDYWGARTLLASGWDARYWGARYWGARYWGTGAWQ